MSTGHTFAQRTTKVIFNAAFLSVLFVGSPTLADASTLFDQAVDTDVSSGSYYSDNWYQLGTSFSGIITSITLRGFVDVADYYKSEVYLDEFNDSNYSNINQTFILSLNAPFTTSVQDITLTGLNITLKPDKYYRLQTYQNRQNASVILKGVSGIGTAMYADFIWPGRKEFRYSFYPYIVVNKTEREPVIIIPGLLGTRLNRASDGEEVWPNVEKLLSPSDNQLNDLKLDSIGNEFPTKVASTTNIILEEKVFLNKAVFYGPLVDNFISVGYSENENLFLVPYDWRLDLKEESIRLKSKIDEARVKSPTGKVNIIAHSLGGVLLKEYLDSQVDTSFLNKIILLGVPQLGVPEAFKALNYGDNFGFSFGLLDILNPERIKEISQNMPSVYELLPSRKYTAVNGGYVKDFRNGKVKILNYDEISNLMLSNPNDSRNAGLLTRADSFHEALDSHSLNAPRVYNFVGCKNPATIGEIYLYDNGSIDINPENGDGTVPLVSAMNLADGYANYFVSSALTGIDHLGLIRDARIINLIQNIISEKAAPEISGISTSTSMCVEEPTNPPVNQTTIRFSTHSPVTLHVYDSANRHTGPTADGNIELAIPGSSYERLEENTFIFVPGGDAYHVEIDALAQGKFTLKVKGFFGEHTLNAIAYPAVPLTGSSTIGKLFFSNFDVLPRLQMDFNGDGTTDSTIQPAGILHGKDSGDSTPPVILLAPISEEIVLGSDARINFTISDDLSGVGFIEAKLDGQQIQGGYSIHNLHVGLHNLDILAVDKTGNPSTLHATFRIIYKFGGFLPPLNKLKTVKCGSSLPVKFRLQDASGKFVSDALVKLYAVDAIGNQLFLGTFNASDDGEFDDSGNSDSNDSKTYHFNLKTKMLSPGSWQLRVELDDGKSYTVNILVK